MKISRQGLNYLVIVVVSLLMALGSIIAAIAEEQQSGFLRQATSVQNPDTPTPTATIPISSPQASPTMTTLITTVPSFPTQTPIPPTASPTQIYTAQECSPPNDWIPFFVQPGNTLAEIAEDHGTTPEILRTGNCLQTNNLEPGSVIFVPALAPTQTSPTI